MEEEESPAINSASSPTKKESGYFEENCGDELSEVIFSNYNHYGALLSIDPSGILIKTETRRSEEHWEESRQGSSFSSGLVEDINDLDVNDSDETKDDVIKDSEEIKNDIEIVMCSEVVVTDYEDPKEDPLTHEDPEVILSVQEDTKAIIEYEAPVCIHEDSQDVLYIHEDSKAIIYLDSDSETVSCTEDSIVEYLTSPSVIIEDDVEISNTGKVSLSIEHVTSSSFTDPFVLAGKPRLFVISYFARFDR